MRISEISFCDTVGYNIRSDETKKMILDNIEGNYGIKIITKHFEKYNERSMGIINKNPHLICVRTNGNPYYLYFKRHNNHDICMFIDKKIQQGYFLPRMILSHIMIGTGSIHDGTLLEGEMVKQKDGRWVYLINDLIVYKGKYLSEYNTVKRLNILYDMLVKEYKRDECCPFDLKVKKYFTFDEFKGCDFLSYMNALPYTCRGLYFKPLFMKFKDILMNFDDSLVKEVKREKVGGGFQLTAPLETTDSDTASEASVTAVVVAPPINTNNNKNTTGTNKVFATRKTAAPDVYDLFDSNGEIIGTACIPTLKISKKIREIFASKNMIDKVNIEYIFNEKFEKWQPNI